MKISVIIPMFNGSATIGKALDSLRRQDVQKWEALVIDDGSTDQGKGAAVVSAEASRDGRVRLITQKNGGVCRARTTGLVEARGESVWFLDADDWMLPRGLDVLLEAADRGGTGAAVGKFEMVGSRGQLLSVEGPWSEEIGLQQLLGGIFMTIHGHVVKREWYEARGGMPPLRFDPELKLIEDTDLWLKLSERGVVWKNAQASVCAYLMRSDSRSVDFAAMLDCAIRVYRAAYARVGSIKANGAAASVDDSPARLENLLGNAAVGYATRLAISRPGAMEAARELLMGSPGIKGFEAQRLARLGRHAVMFALGDRPESAGEKAEWWDRLQQWWGVLAAEGCVVGGGAALVVEEFEAAGRPRTGNAA